MALTIRAVYEQGRLRPLDPVDLVEGQQVRLIVEPTDEENPLTREVLRARLKAANLLSEVSYAPPDAVPLSPEERARIGHTLAGERPVEDLINEDRGQY
jgi:predicted DNA-binding antitoxin AbrB/MazE fold protein